MNNSKFVFVILHYFTIDDTIKCINSIAENVNNYEIVIVDNASSNNTGKLLLEKYSSDSKIHVIINEQNLGFARGNNVGFKYAKENLSPDYIILCNNDTYLLNNEFSEEIDKEFRMSNFAVLGPKILLPNNKICKINRNLPTTKNIHHSLMDLRITLMLAYMGLSNLYKKIRNRKNNNTDNNSIENRREDCLLHGCFLIFSKNYIDKFDGLDDRTFLYCEEELLFIRLIKNNMKSVYNPNVEIFHADDSSTNAVTKTKRKKTIFVCKNAIKSNKILLNELKNMQ